MNRWIWIPLLAAPGVACDFGSVVVTDGVGGADVTTTAGGSSAGGATPGGSGPGGNPGPCMGIPCSTIEAPPCKQSVCDETIGQCVIVAASDDTPCDDGVFCTVGDRCVSGQCTGHEAQTCGLQPPSCQVVVCHEDAQSCELSVGCVSGDGCCPATCDATDDDCVLDILLMGMGNSTHFQPFQATLQALGATHDTVNLWTEPFPSAAVLNQYDTVILFRSFDLAIGEPEAQILASWLTADHHLFAVGTHIANQFATGGPAAQAFFALWGVTYMATGSLPEGFMTTIMIGAAGDPIGDAFAMAPYLWFTVDNDPIFSSWADETAGPAVHAALYGPQSGPAAGHSGLTHYTAPTHQVVWLGAQFDEIAVPQAVMKSVLDFFTYD